MQESLANSFDSASVSAADCCLFRVCGLQRLCKSVAGTFGESKLLASDFRAETLIDATKLDKLHQLTYLIGSSKPALYNTGTLSYILCLTLGRNTHSLYCDKSGVGALLLVPAHLRVPIHHTG